MQLAARSSQAAVDVFIIVVLAVHGGLFLHERQEQHRFDSAAERVAEHTREMSVDRIAWPADARAAVPQFLERGVTPVLYAPSPPPAQLLAVNEAPLVALEEGSDPIEEIEPIEERELAGWRVVLVDLREAARVPLNIGEQVGQEYARPFVYTPLRDSRALADAAPLIQDLWLAPGAYTFGLRVLDPEDRRRAVHLSARVGDQPVGEVAVRAGPVATDAATLRFEVTGTSPVRVTVEARLAEDGRDGAPLRVHRWWVVRED